MRRLGVAICLLAVGYATACGARSELLDDAPRTTWPSGVDGGAKEGGGGDAGDATAPVEAGRVMADATTESAGEAGGRSDAATEGGEVLDATLDAASVDGASMDGTPLDSASLDVAAPPDAVADVFGADVDGGGFHACNPIAWQDDLGCLGGKAFKCTSNGLWMPACDCWCGPSGFTCTTDCQCVPGATQCLGNAVETCDTSGNWANPVECVDSECFGGVCLSNGKCAPGTAQCVGNSLLTCASDGTWGTPVTCCGDCAAGWCNIPGGTQCSDGGEIETCQDGGTWGAPVSCPSQQTCVATVGVCLCAPGATQCSGGLLQVCKQYNFWASVACDGGDACDGGVVTCSTTDGGTDDAEPPEASLDEATVPGDATADDATVADATPDVPEAGGDADAFRACNPQTGTYVSCLNGQAFDCQANGVWTPDCECMCSSGGGWSCAVAGGCVAGATQCSGNGVQTCNDHCSWGPADECVDSECINGACNVPCAPGASRCVGNYVQTCDATGTWGSMVLCANQLCVAGACTGSCAPGTAECIGNTVLKCAADGTWGNPVTCCGDCASGLCSGPGATVCSGNGVATCQSDGTWGAPVPCASQLCRDGICECATGDTLCSGGVLMACDSYGYWEYAPCDGGACDGGRATCAMDSGE